MFENYTFTWNLHVIIVLIILLGYLVHLFYVGYKLKENDFKVNDFDSMAEFWKWFIPYYMPVTLLITLIKKEWLKNRKKWSSQQ
jgi:surface polysaccharide O-acyltransferase-like enzyme